MLQICSPDPVGHDARCRLLFFSQSLSPIHINTHTPGERRAQDVTTLHTTTTQHASEFQACRDTRIAKNSSTCDSDGICWYGWRLYICRNGAPPLRPVRLCSKRLPFTPCGLPNAGSTRNAIFQALAEDLPPLPPLSSHVSRSG